MPRPKFTACHRFCRRNFYQIVILLLTLYLALLWLLSPEQSPMWALVRRVVRSHVRHERAAAAAAFPPMPRAPPAPKRPPAARRPPVFYVRDYDVSFTVSNMTSAQPVARVPPAYGSCDGFYESFNDVGPQVYVYSVYWDPRQNDVDNPNNRYVFLRIMAVAESIPGSHKSAVYCVFRTAAGSPLPVPATYHRLMENHDGIWGGYVLSCKVPKFVYGADRLTALCHVQLSPSMYPRHESWSLFKIINTAPVTPQRDVTVCVPPLFDIDVPDEHLVEFMELTRLLGASHVTFYENQLSTEAGALLDYYVNISLATLLPWELNASVVDGPALQHVQLVAIMDCLYRNMAVSRYVAFMDLNEYIVPYLHTSWYEMLDYLDANDSSAFQFRGVTFDSYSQNRSSQENARGGELRALNDTWRSLRTLTDTWRSLRPDLVRSRCIVKPQLIVEVGAHHVIRTVLTRYTTRRVSYPVALLHRHRACEPPDDGDCAHLARDVIVPQRYSSLLQQLVQQRWARFQLQHDDTDDITDDVTTNDYYRSS